MNDKKHILFLSSWYPNKNAPTLGNFVQKHAEAVALYNSVSAISIFSHNERGYTVDSETKNGVTSTVVYYPKVTVSIPIIKQLIQYNRRKKAFKIAYDKLIKEFGKPDLVHVNVVYPIGVAALWLKSKERIPYIVTEHSTVFHSNKLSFFTLKSAVHWMNRADKIIPVSEDLKNALIRVGVKTPMEIVSNVVNETIFGTLPLSDPARTQFIHISTAIDEHKNVSGIIRSIFQLSQTNTNFRFLIVSDGNLEPFIDLAYNRLSISKELLQFEGTKTTEEIAELINESSALVLFSNYENFPCVIPESFMLGKPVITTNVNGIPEHVNQSNGILIESKNEGQLVRAMLDIIEAKRKFDKEAIRKYAVEYFSYQAVGKKFDAIYNEILNRNVS